MSIEQMRLEEATTFWGGAEVRSERPTLETFHDVYYTPFVSDGPWGIFDRNDSILEPCVDRAYVEGVTLRHQPVSPTSYDKTVEHFDGECIYVGRINSHFGHFLVETLPRYWTLTHRRWFRPKLLIHKDVFGNGFSTLPFAAQIFKALGLRSEDFIAFDRPTRLKRVIVPHASFRQQAWAHPVYGDLCRYIGRRLCGGDVSAPNPRPVWLSKSRLVQGVTRLANEADLEKELARLGVDIVHPEQMSLKEQVHLYARRPTVMGTTGSALHVSIFAPPPKTMIGLSWENAINSNYKLFDAMSGARTRFYYDPETVKRDDEPGFLTTARLPDPARTARELLSLID